MADRMRRWQRFTQAVGDARRTLPIRSERVRARLRGYETAYAYMVESDRRGARALGDAAPDDGRRASLRTAEAAGEPRTRVGVRCWPVAASSRRLRGDAPGVGRARRVARAAGAVAAAGRARSAKGRRGRHVAARPPCPADLGDADPAAHPGEIVDIGLRNNAARGSPGPMRRPPPRRTAARAGSGSRRSTAT